MNPFVVAVIDDGIAVYDRKPELALNIKIDSDGSVSKCVQPFSFSHGTLCADIIRAQARGVPFASIKVLNKEGKSTIRQLCSGIEVAISHGFPLINMSLGTVEKADAGVLRELVHQAFCKGIIIVAACHNLDYRSYPASFQQVIGVKMHRGMEKKHGFIFHHDPEDGIDVEVLDNSIEEVLLSRGEGPAFHLLKHIQHMQQVPGIDSSCARDYFSTSNSYAASYITGLIASEFTDRPPTYRDVQELLFEKSVEKVEAGNTV